MFISIEKSNRKDKRFVAIIYDSKMNPKEKINFGAKNGSTYIDHHDKIKKENYIKRHSGLNEDWTKINAGSLSRYILWEYPNLETAIKEYAKRFGLSLKKGTLSPYNPLVNAT